jgi:DNA-binding CsgD family transcriptional regulator/tetratricopeptide (TPR) repeat protein
MQDAAPAAALLERARNAAASGDRPTARACFEASLAAEESGEALFGLGITLWWLGETEPAIRSWERAYAHFRRAAYHYQAVAAAFYLCLVYRMSLGNDAASRGWLGRAATLVEELGLDHLAAWIELCRAHVATDSGRPGEGEEHARKAHASARATGDADVELCALSEHGAALVERGRVADGTAMLDEAMAGALGGEVDDLDAVVYISCRTITSCSRGGDAARASQWVRAASDFHGRYGSPYLYTVCRTHFGGVLFATGEWERADRELRDALRIGRDAEPALHAEALATTAELRLAQGHVEEAARLLDGLDAHPQAACATAAVRLAEGRAPAAAALLVRRLRELEGGISLGFAATAELLCEVEVTGGRVPEASAWAERLAALAADADSVLVLARAERAAGRTLLAAGDGNAARRRLESALACFDRLGMPYEGARTRLLLSRSMADRMRDAAIAEAQSALACFEDLGAARDADGAAAFLRSLGVRAARAGPKGIGLLTRREREVLELLGEGLTNPAIAERLIISRKTVEHHVASVLGKLGVGGRGEAAAIARRRLGDQGSAQR